VLNNYEVNSENCLQSLFALFSFFLLQQKFCRSLGVKSDLIFKLSISVFSLLSSDSLLDYRYSIKSRLSIINIREKKEIFSSLYEINSRDVIFFYLSPTISSRKSFDFRTFFSFFLFCSMLFLVYFVVFHLKKYIHTMIFISPRRQITSLYFEAKSNDENDTLNALFSCYIFSIFFHSMIIAKKKKTKNHV
jgi:hypothetical protein